MRYNLKKNTWNVDYILQTACKDATCIQLRFHNQWEIWIIFKINDLYNLQLQFFGVLQFKNYMLENSSVFITSNNN